MNTTYLSELNMEEISQIEGGSFAYDAGRVFRFLGISVSQGPYGFGVQSAIADWIGTSVMNESL